MLLGFIRYRMLHQRQLDKLYYEDWQWCSGLPLTNLLSESENDQVISSTRCHMT